MLPVNGSHTIRKIPFLEESISNGTPVVLLWHSHELIHQAVPDDLAHLAHDSGYCAVPHTVTETDGSKGITSGKVSVKNKETKNIIQQ